MDAGETTNEVNFNHSRISIEPTSYCSLIDVQDVLDFFNMWPGFPSDSLGSGVTFNRDESSWTSSGQVIAPEGATNSIEGGE